MTFNSFQFLFLMLPLAVLAFHLPALRPHRTLTLILASFLFYGASGLIHAGSLIASLLWVYVLTSHHSMAGNRQRVIAASILPLSSLIYFKYSTFLMGDVFGFEGQSSEVFSLLQHVILPAGISFFTFQLISFVIDRYRGEIETQPRFLDFALYISFFPQLVAGPIVRFHQVGSHIEKITAWRIDTASLERAVSYFCFGLALKVVLADSLQAAVAPMTKSPNELSSLTAAYTMFAYSFQIYFDFFGYSLMAIGLGHLFGFQLPPNFAEPYQALNARDFWRRWHLTLSSWLRDYLYLPLGGNNNYARNILIVFAVCGLWHGAGWTFIVWGLYHALLVISYHYSRGYWDRMPGVVQCLATFILVSFGWILFLFDFEGSKAIVFSLFGQGNNTIGNVTVEMWLVLLVSAFICFGVSITKLLDWHPTGRRQAGAAAVSMSILLVVSLMLIDRSTDFIYFRF